MNVAGVALMGIVFVAAAVIGVWFVALRESEQQRMALAGAALYFIAVYGTGVCALLIVSAVGAIHVVLGWITAAFFFSVGMVLFTLGVTRVPVVGSPIALFVAEFDRIRLAQLNERFGLRDKT